MPKHTQPAHSPLGASGAHKWMVCFGSVYQSEGIEEDDSDFAVDGNASHALGEHCLVHNVEPWTLIGTVYDKEAKELILDGSEKPSDRYIPITKEMADCIYDYIAAIDMWHPDRNQGNTWVERSFKCPSIHELFYGTSDLVHLNKRTLHIWDYKNGAGVVVEAIDNPQGMYYAAGIIEDLMLWDSVDTIVIHIFQPRGWHSDGPHRTWTITTDYLDAWLADCCVPAMERALVSRDTVYGSHCRFCPARGSQCPAIMGAVVELEELLTEANKKVTKMLKDGEKIKDAEVRGADDLTNDQLGRLMDLKEISGIIFKAAATRAYKLLSNGKEVPGVKLVKSRTNRKFKKGGETAAKRKFGNKCMTKSVVMSATQLEALPGGKEFAARWAFKPEGKTTVAPEGDPRRRVIRGTKSLFTKKDKG